MRRNHDKNAYHTHCLLISQANVENERERKIKYKHIDIINYVSTFFHLFAFIRDACILRAFRIATKITNSVQTSFAHSSKMMAISLTLMLMWDVRNSNWMKTFNMRNDRKTEHRQPERENKKNIKRVNEVIVERFHRILFVHATMTPYTRKMNESIELNPAEQWTACVCVCIWK